ncbi:MAG TPA: fructose-6-phosphate aldolase [Bryobacteraceae bacterium]|jgi:transaldolase|nr:fructose-6-phosphate aldolase [Bryobacteraceae bacterium]
MKFFLDTANVEEVKRALVWRIIDGVTTNPSLIAKEGVPIEDQLLQICALVDGDVSAPVLSTTTAEILPEARSLAKIHKNIVVKVPVTPDGIAAVSALANEGIRTNVTLCFTPMQALLAAKAGAAFVSPFMGRVEDQGGSGFELLQDIATIYRNFDFQTKILAASVRGPHHLIQAAKAGAHVATMSFKLMESLFQHPLTDKGLEQFRTDYSRAFDFVKA